MMNDESPSTGMPDVSSDLNADIRLVLAGLRAVAVEATRRSGWQVAAEEAVSVALGDADMPEAFAAYERLMGTFGMGGDDAQARRNGGREGDGSARNADAMARVPAP